MGVLVVGGCGTLIATVGVSAFQQMQAARMAADDFLSAVERGDTATAEHLLCDEAAPDAVQQAAASGLVHHRIVGVAIVGSNGFGSETDHASATVTVDVIVAGGARHRDVLDLQREHDRWVYCGVIRTENRD